MATEHSLIFCKANQAAAKGEGRDIWIGRMSVQPLLHPHPMHLLVKSYPCAPCCAFCLCAHAQRSRVGPALASQYEEAGEQGSGFDLRNSFKRTRDRLDILTGAASAEARRVHLGRQ
jgi:hypothetical protein